MMVRIPAVLSAQEVAHFRTVLANAEWVDGKVTAGQQSAAAKHNLQVSENTQAARELGEIILRKLGSNELFVSSALPLRVYPPLFNRYDEGMNFDTHIDNAIRMARDARQRVRTDLSATLFLTPPEEYDGGELVVEDTYGTHSVKLAAGDMVLYPGKSRHHVTAVTRGSRWSSFFWIQSMVRDDGARELLYELDVTVQALRQRVGDSAEMVRLTGLYHNLLRRWAETN